MKDLLIILRTHEEVANERVAEIVSEIEGYFFSNPDKKVKYFPISDSFFCFSKRDTEEIYKRLNNHPNLFNINFGISRGLSNIDIGGYDYYLKIEALSEAA